MKFIWRFYMDQDRRWRWQRLAMDKTVSAESKMGYKEYEGCLANAKNEGYVFHPSHAKIARAAH